MKTHPTNAFFLLMVPLALATSCTPPGNEINRLYPELTVVTPAGTEDAVDFGGVIVPYQEEIGFQIVNTGRADLEIADIRIEDGEGLGVYEIEPSEGVVEPDDALGVVVRFSPHTYDRYNRSIVIQSNDPEKPEYELALLGEGIDGPVPDIELASPSVDLGIVPVGEESLDFVTIENVGDGELIIDRIELEGLEGSTAFTLESSLQTGGVIPGLGSSTVVVHYTPEVEDGEVAVATIYSNDPDEPEVRLYLVGNGGKPELYPVAVIDCPATADPPINIDLDGLASYDPSGNEPLQYEWSVVERPFGSSSQPRDPYVGFTSLLVDAAGPWGVQLEVTNTLGLTSDPARCSFDAEPQAAVHIELSWDTTNSDLDLHLIQAGTGFFQLPGDACWCNVNPNWGTSSGADDPHLALDNVVGLGPEDMRIRAPADGDYRVKVHYFDDKDGGITTATVKVYLNGGTEPAWQGSKVLAHNQVWDVGYVQWPSAEFVEETTDVYRAPRRRCYAPED